MTDLLGLDAAASKPTARVVLTPADHHEAVAKALDKNLVLGWTGELTKYDLSPLKGRVVTLWLDCDQDRPLKETLARVHAVCEAVSKVAAETAWFDTTPLHDDDQLPDRAAVIAEHTGAALTGLLKSRRKVWRPSDTAPAKPALTVVPSGSGGAAAKAAAKPSPSSDPDEEPAADPGDLLPLAYTHDALAQQFVERHAGRWLYCSEAKRWRLWDGTVWADDRRLAVQNDARILCREQADRAAMDLSLSVPKQASTASMLSSRNTLDAVLGVARTDPRISIDEAAFDADPWLLNTPAGVVDLRTGEMLAHKPERLMMRITAAEPLMREDGSLCAECPRWMEFLHHIHDDNEEIIEFLQVFAGYSLTGITTEQQFVFAYGTGGNGKGSFTNAISGLMGDYSAVASMDVLTEQRFNNAQKSAELAALKGVRFVSAQETEEGKRWDEQMVKQLTGGDPVTAKRLYENPITFMPQFKLFIAGNYQPMLHNVDEAIKRRINLVPFTRTVTERDVTLPEKLREEWPGILSWMLEGCRIWVGHGLKPPAVVRAATDEYLSEQDPLASWLADRTRQEEGATVKSRDLYADYAAYTRQSGEGVYSERRFAQNMMARGFKRHRNAGGRYYSGITLLPDIGAPYASRMPWDRD